MIVAKLLREREHTTTDPACLFYRRPRWVWERIAHERARGKSCQACMRGVV